ncbi:hypothetical protein JOM56_002790, partial [Amanita muscaria]
TLGIKTTSGVFTKLIAHNAVIPTRKSQVPSPLPLTINPPSLFEGEHSLTKDNNHLGKFELTGIPCPCAVSQIEVTFEIDAKGILKLGGKSESITIKNEKGHLSEEEIERMVAADASIPMLLSHLLLVSSFH